MQTLVTEPLHLADTRCVWLRPPSFEDAPRLVDLCQSISPESRRRRFLRSTVPCDAREAERLASVDQAERVAVAVVPSPTPDAPIIGVGRFHTDSPRHAELALLVDDPLSGSRSRQTPAEPACRPGLPTGVTCSRRPPVLRQPADAP